jgi:hypothetical protein
MPPRRSTTTAASGTTKVMLGSMDVVVVPQPVAGSRQIEVKLHDLLKIFYQDISACRHSYKRTRRRTGEILSQELSDPALCLVP